MTGAVTTYTTSSRRGALGVAAALATAAIAGGAAAPGADAQLVALTEELMRLYRDYDALPEEAEDTPEAAAMWDAINSAEEQIENLSSEGMAGVLAKARLCRFFAEEHGGGCWADSYIGLWGQLTTEDLLRLHGEG